VSESRLGGTAFIVSVSEEARDFKYLVTAKHVAKKLSLGGDWFIRINSLQGDYQEIKYPATQRWFYHPDKDDGCSVDAAVMPFDIPANFRYSMIPSTMFATTSVIETEIGLGPGDEIFVTGLFTKLTGKKANIPVVRIGNIAMIPKEKVPGVKIGDWEGESNVYLTEIRSMGGLSGSPVFVRETVGHKVNLSRELMSRSGKLGEISTQPLGTWRQSILWGSGSYFLLGLMHGHWLLRAGQIDEIKIEAVSEDCGDSIASGMSVVVPAQKIIEIIEHPDLKAMRQEHIGAARAKQGSTIETGTL
jgi:hypothetical protein